MIWVSAARRRRNKLNLLEKGVLETREARLRNAWYGSQPLMASTTFLFSCLFAKHIDTMELSVGQQWDRTRQDRMGGKVY